jgi:hypothetical protein
LVNADSDDMRIVGFVSQQKETLETVIFIPNTIFMAGQEYCVDYTDVTTAFEAVEDVRNITFTIFSDRDASEVEGANPVFKVTSEHHY